MISRALKWVNLGVSLECRLTATWTETNKSLHALRTTSFSLHLGNTRKCLGTRLRDFHRIIMPYFYQSVERTIPVQCETIYFRRIRR